jgi:hypothetical protein
MSPRGVRTSPPPQYGPGISTYYQITTPNNIIYPDLKFNELPTKTKHSYVQSKFY